MSDTDNIRPSSNEVSFLKAPKVLRVKTDNSKDQTTPTEDIKEELRNQITVEYERVGSFQVFETICPLEFFDMPSKTVEVSEKNHLSQKCESNVKIEKKSKKVNAGGKLMDSESDDELTASFKKKVRTVEESPKKLITLDAFFRSENPRTAPEVAGEATVFWAKGDCVSSSHVNGDESNDSDLDPEVEMYIKSQKEKKKRGETLTGEVLWFDQERSIIRNLHENGSVSLTSYDDTDEKFFGKTEIFNSIMTCEERAMLRPKSPEPVKIEKKKRPLESRKKVKKPSRPKDQGDWVG